MEKICLRNSVKLDIYAMYAQSAIQEKQKKLESGIS